MNLSPKDVMVFIESSSPVYYQDRLFQDDPVLNRDNCLSPFHKLRNSLSEKIMIDTYLNRLGDILEKIEGELWSRQHFLPIHFI